MNSGEPSLASSEPRLDNRYEPVTSRAKIEAVMRLLKGESVEAISQEFGVTVQRIERWRHRFVEAGSAELARRRSDSSKSWMAKYSGSIWQWIWLLVALVGVISFLAVFMQRGSPD